jgi:hypothetical protein
MLHVLFALDRCDEILVTLEIDESLQRVSLGEPFYDALAMFSHTAYKVACDTHVKCPVRAIGEDVEITSHMPMIASGTHCLFYRGHRDKPGDDRHE